MPAFNLLHFSKVPGWSVVFTGGPKAHERYACGGWWGGLAFGQDGRQGRLTAAMHTHCERLRRSACPQNGHAQFPGSLPSFEAAGAECPEITHFQKLDSLRLVFGHVHWTRLEMRQLPPKLPAQGSARQGTIEAQSWHIACYAMPCGEQSAPWRISAKGSLKGKYGKRE